LCLQTAEPGHPGMDELQAIEAPDYRAELKAIVCVHYAGVACRHANILKELSEIDTESLSD
jgi:dTDP-4-amino-4,6-dideoxygalactose transaminase